MMVANTIVAVGVGVQSIQNCPTLGETLTINFDLNTTFNPVVVALDEQRPNFIFMVKNAPAHQGSINREQLLGAEEPRMEWPAHSPDLNLRENLQLPNYFHKIFFCHDSMIAPHNKRLPLPYFTVSPNIIPIMMAKNSLLNLVRPWDISPKSRFV